MNISFSNIRQSLHQWIRNPWVMYYIMVFVISWNGVSAMRILLMPPVSMSIRVSMMFYLIVLHFGFLFCCFMMTKDIERRKKENARIQEMWGTAKKMFDDYDAEVRTQLKQQSGRKDLANDPISMAAAYVDVHEQHDALVISNNLFRAILTDNLGLAQEYLNRLDEGLL